MSDYQAAYENAERAIGGPELEYIHLGYALQADAHYIATLTKAGDHDIALEYIRSTRFLERRNAWQQGRP